MELTREQKAEEAKLVAEHMELVERVAKKYAGFGVPHDDLVQEGMLGLLTAIRRWDATRSASLGTLAFFHVKAHIRKSLGLENVAPEGRKRPRREKSKRSNYTPLGTSLDAPIGDTDTPMHDVIAADGPTPEESCAQAEEVEHARETVEQAIRVLRADELDVICDRFDNDVTLQEIGKRRGVTRERVRQIEASGLARMRKVLRA
jgi:RNA polymerase sigma factor (sigma-70 family)